MASPVQDREVSGLAGVVLRAWRSRSAARQPRFLRVVESLALGGRKHVHLVACGESLFMVGTGPDAVQCIVAADGANEAKSLVAK